MERTPEGQPTKASIAGRITAAFDEYREATGVPIERVVADAGLTMSKYYRHRSGDTEPSALEVYRISQLTGKPFSWFANVEPGQPSELLVSRLEAMQQRAGDLATDLHTFLEEAKQLRLAFAGGPFEEAKRRPRRPRGGRSDVG